MLAQLTVSLAVPARLRIRCPVCGTSVLADDDVVHANGALLHRECDRYARSRRRARRVGL
jgi:hypothetical protein